LTDFLGLRIGFDFTAELSNDIRNPFALSVVSPKKSIKTLFQCFILKAYLVIYYKSIENLKLIRFISVVRYRVKVNVKIKVNDRVKVNV